ncbi:hypothetical protein N431DRAFT_436607 [Stipitochalara longipes BDJ]|nr:hypothetical protein N431DRAFT_436607 [Stipitochalara longipes BDJ]
MLQGVLSEPLFISSVCVDPPGFDSCWNTATADAISLFKDHCTNGTCTGVDDCFSPDETCAKIATCVAYTEWISCALNHCWNRVYNCEYQHLAIRAMRNCPVADQLPPHIPPPIGAPGTCSCGIGFVFAEHLKMNKPGAGELFQCTSTIEGLQAAGTCKPNCANEEKICQCCADSSATSTFFNTCPSTDPADVFFFSDLGYDHLISAECSSSLGTSPDCTAKPYNFTLSPGAGSNNQFFDAATIPKNGSDPLTNNPGGLATPVSGAVFTWSLYDGAVATANATVTKWTGAGATTLPATTGTVTSASGAAGVTSAGPASTANNSGPRSTQRAGLVLMGSLLLSLTL